MFFSTDASSKHSLLQRLNVRVSRSLDPKPVRLALVGASAILVSYGVFAAVYLLSHHRLRSLAVMTVLGVASVLFTQGRPVFASRGVKALAPFALVYGVLLLINAVLLEVLVRRGAPTLVGQAMLLPALAALSYPIIGYCLFPSRGREIAAGLLGAVRSFPYERVLRWIGPASLAACLVLAVVIMKRRLYAVSPDLAQHYELTRFLATHWTWPSGTPLSSGIQTYPPLSHYLGAVAGLVFGSSLIGMNVVVVAAIFGCYWLLARPLTAGGPASAVVAVAIAALGLWWLRSQRSAEGFEVYGNFFYAQLVGETVFLATALWLSNEKRSWLVRWSVTAVMTAVCVWLYLIAAIEIALAYLALEALLLVRRVVAERTFRVRWATPILVGVSTLPWLIYFHPYFRPMVQVSNNDGALALGALETLIPECAAVLLAVGLVLGLAPLKGERWRGPLLFLAVACCATASAALAQTLAFDVARIGSPYAVKKYGFAVATLLVFGVGALVGSRLDEWRPRRPWRVLAMSAPPLFALATVIALPSSTPFNLDRFVAYQREVGALLHDPRTPPDAFGNTASMNDDFGLFLNHTVTMVDLGMGQARSLGALGVMGAPSETYMILKASTEDASDKCVVNNPRFPDISFFMLKCGPLSGGEPLRPGDRVVLRDWAAKPPIMTDGWNQKETNGVWSSGHRSTMVLRIAKGDADPVLVLEGSGFLPTPNYQQRVKVRAGSVAVAEWTMDARTPAPPRSIVIPRRLVSGDELALEFDFPDATSPAAQKVSTDPRQLALFLTAVGLQAPARQQ